MMDFKTLKLFIAIAAFYFSPYSGACQSELILIEPISSSFSNNSGVSPTVQNITVPQGHIIKITSAGCGANQNLNAVSTDRSQVICDLLIDGNIIFSNQGSRPQRPFPIWLSEGSYSFQLIVNAAAGNFNGYFYALKFEKQ